MKYMISITMYRFIIMRGFKLFKIIHCLLNQNTPKMPNASKHVHLSNSSRFKMVIIIYLKVVSADTLKFMAQAA